MNDLFKASIAVVTEIERITDQDLRNAIRRARWAERWRRAFPANPPVDINAKADAARLTTCFAEDLISPVRQEAEIIVHPAFFERHGNQNRVRIQRHRRQISANIQGPDEAA